MLSLKSHPWRKALVDRIFALWLLKPLGIGGFMVVFFLLYFHLLRSPQFPVTEMPLTALDRWIAFSEPAFWPYVSLWLYVSLPPSLMPDRKRLLRFGAAATALAVAGLAIFRFYPTRVPVPTTSTGELATFRLLGRWDAAGNACPSLHAAFAVFSAVVLHAVLHEIRAPWLFKAVNLIWCGAILYSTLATKQHVALDLYAGCGLGAFFGWLFLGVDQRAQLSAKCP